MSFVAARQRERILNLLLYHSPEKDWAAGLTSYDLEDQLRYERQVINRRLQDLEKQGLAERNTHSKIAPGGNRAPVWRATNKARGIRRAAS